MQRDDEWDYFDGAEFKLLLKNYEEGEEAGKLPYLDAESLTDISEYYMMMGKEEAAMNCIHYALSIHPGSVDPQIFLSRKAMFEGDMKQAHEICDAITDQMDREVLFLRAELLIRDGEEDAAFQSMFEQYQQNTDNKAEFLHDCIDVCLDYDFFGKALQWALLLRSKHPKYKEGRMVQATILHKMEKEEDACRLLDEEIDANPYNVKAWVMRAETQLAMHEASKALESAEFALAIDAHRGEALLAKMQCLFQLNRSEEALEVGELYHQWYPNDDRGWYYTGLYLSEVDRSSEAMVHLERAMNLDHMRSGIGSELYLHLSMVYSNLGMVDKAIRILDTAETMLQPGDHMEKKVLIGRVLLENKREDEAFQIFDEAMAESKDRSATAITLGGVFCDLEYYDRCLLLLEPMKEELDKSLLGYALAYLVYCYYNLHIWNKYLIYLPDAIEANSSFVEFLLGKYYPGKRVDEYLYATLSYLMQNRTLDMDDEDLDDEDLDEDLDDDE